MDLIRQYYLKHLFLCSESGTYYILPWVLKEYLALRLDFKLLCQMVLQDRDSSLIDFFSLLIRMQLHVKDKETRSLKNASDGMQKIMSVIAPNGSLVKIPNQNIDAYIPADEMEAAISMRPPSSGHRGSTLNKASERWHSKSSCQKWKYQHNHAPKALAATPAAADIACLIGLRRSKCFASAMPPKGVSSTSQPSAPHRYIASMWAHSCHKSATAQASTSLLGRKNNASAQMTAPAGWIRMRKHFFILRSEPSFLPDTQSVPAHALQRPEVFQQSIVQSHLQRRRVLPPELNSFSNCRKAPPFHCHAVHG